jgi:putative spermidine/putrescine transport system permease protein
MTWGAGSTARQAPRWRGFGRQWLVLPMVAYLFVFYLLPVARLLALSFWKDGPTLASFSELVQHPEYVIVLGTTMRIALGVTAFTLAIGYPVAYFLTRLHGRRLVIAMILVTLPFWTSVLVRTFAWIVILGRVGIINHILMTAGLIGQPLALVFNRIGVYIGLVHVLLPLMILPLYSVMRGIDTRLLLAADSLGAPPSQTFLRVFFPLSLPGVTAACLLVFIGAAGSYITPALLGSAQDLMLAQLIFDQVNMALNWPLAAALTVVLLGATALILVVYFKLVGSDKMWGGGV